MQLPDSRIHDLITDGRFVSLSQADRRYDGIPSTVVGTAIGVNVHQEPKVKPFTTASV